MRLDSKDIEAIAKSRVNRKEGNKTNYWMIGSLIAVVIGVFVMKTQIYTGWACLIGGVGTFLWYMNLLAKKQNNYRDALMKEWEREQKK